MKASLPARITIFAAITCLLSVVLFIAARQAAVTLNMTPAGQLAMAVTFLVILPILAIGARRMTRKTRRTSKGLTDALRSFQDGDFSMRLNEENSGDLTEAIQAFNEVADVLRAERNALFQKELLLDTILQGAPMAVFLTNPADRIVYSNHFARQLFGGGASIDGYHSRELIARAPEPVRQAFESDADALVSFRNGDQDETFHLSRRVFYLNTQKHTLVVTKRLTQELRRQEIEIWKKAIRLMNHELNNSIAPISSLLHSFRHVANHPEHAHRTEEILQTIDERLGYLKKFLQGYAQFARLPVPQLREVRWHEVIDGVRDMFPFTVQGSLPAAPVRIDPAQIQQVLINLLKNANETGSPAVEIALSVSANGAGTTIQVLDRGPGMTTEEMERALLPFYSSKQTGTGLGLPLCNEIIEAHGGHLRLQNRPGGGLTVTCWLP